MRIPFVFACLFGLLLGLIVFQLFQEVPDFLRVIEIGWFQFVALVMFWYCANKSEYISFDAIITGFACIVAGMFFNKDTADWKHAFEIVFYQLVAIFALWASVKLIRWQRSSLL